MKIMLVGGHQKVNFLAKSLKAKRHKVTVINESFEWCQFLSDTHGIVTVHGDGTKPFVLEDAGAAEMDTLIALSNVDATNLVVCEIAKKQFHVKNTITVVNNPKNVQVFKKLGISKCISATQMISDVIEQEAVIEDLKSYLPIDDGTIAVYQIRVCETSRALEKPIWEIGFPKDCIIGCVIRDGQSFIAKGNTKLKPDDTVVILSTSHAMEQAVSLLSGK